MICSNCKNLINDNAKFCTHCGHKITNNPSENSTANKLERVNMSKIKIISNPYEQIIKYQIYDEKTSQWYGISDSNQNSALREDASGKSFLPFRIKEIIDSIVDEYYAGEPINLVFEGTQDDYDEVEIICNDKEYDGKIELTRSEIILKNARFVFNDIKEEFKKVDHVIRTLMADEQDAIKELNKISDALDDIIPICVFGNYSCGKSTFINSLIGYEILPSGSDPVTAKVYKIKSSVQPDYSSIQYSCLGQSYKIEFTEKDCNFIPDNDDELIKTLKEQILSVDENNIPLKINKALSIINGFETGSKLIEIEVPFNRKGVLGNSHNRFVIFDTPGSNSNSNKDHTTVLREALEGFSNGIPVWVTTYDNVDSEDNAELCDMINLIDALDKRFTMIVINKADGSDLGDKDENGYLLPSREKAILEFNAVEKMYAGGIYFVSSIMGLGSKADGALNDNQYRKEFKKNKLTFTDEEDEDYTMLYRANIMPKQIKEKVVKYCSECDNLVLSNSGLYAVENEMETFATKHSAYNKCKMFDAFLNSVISRTTKRIEYRTNTIEKAKEHWSTQLSSQKKKVLADLSNYRDEAINASYKSSVSDVQAFIKGELDFTRTEDEINNLDQGFYESHKDKVGLAKEIAEYETAVDVMNSNLRANLKGIFTGNPLAIPGKLKAMKWEHDKDSKVVAEQKAERDKAQEIANASATDNTMNCVVLEYRNNMASANSKLTTQLRAIWSVNAEKVRQGLIAKIIGADELTSEQKAHLQNIILNYGSSSINDDAESVFAKKKYVKGSLFGLNKAEIARLNIKLLTKNYNKRIVRNIDEMAMQMNNDYYMAFNAWAKALYETLELNITSFSPELKELVAQVEEQNLKLDELQRYRKTLSSSLDIINLMMSWEEI